MSASEPLALLRLLMLELPAAGACGWLAVNAHTRVSLRRLDWPTGGYRLVAVADVLGLTAHTPAGRGNHGLPSRPITCPRMDRLTAGCGPPSQ